MGQGAVIGLDIGNSTIKVAEVRASKGGAQVVALGIAPTPLDSVNQSIVVDPEAVASTIKELLASSGARARKVVSSVAGQQSLVVRIIEVPRMTEKELAETMKWEVERHVPFASADLQMDYQIIHRPDAPPDAQTMEVLLVVAQQDMITTHLEAVEGAGLQPLAVDVEPLAVSRALVDAVGPALGGQSAALVNIGARTTDVSIVRNGLLLFQRTIATGGDSLTQAIAGALNVGSDEADRIKRMHAFVDLDALDQGRDAADVFGGLQDSPFGFGPPAFEAPASAESPPDEATLFNPFAGGTEAPPQAEAQSPFLASPQQDEEKAPQWSPFGPAPEAETANPFGMPTAPEPPESEVSSPFREPEPAPAGQEMEDAFDLSAFESEGFGASASAGVSGIEGASSQELTPQQVFGIIREPLIDLVTEIKRSVDYYRGRSDESTIDTVLLSGGAACLRNLDQLLSSELGLPVAVADPFRAVPVQSAQYPEEYLRQIAPLFTVSVGLGLRETVF